MLNWLRNVMYFTFNYIPEPPKIREPGNKANTSCVIHFVSVMLIDTVTILTSHFELFFDD